MQAVQSPHPRPTPGPWMGGHLHSGGRRPSPRGPIWSLVTARRPRRHLPLAPCPSGRPSPVRVASWLHPAVSHAAVTRVPAVTWVPTVTRVATQPCPHPLPQRTRSLLSPCGPSPARNPPTCRPNGAGVLASPLKYNPHPRREEDNHGGYSGSRAQKEDPHPEGSSQ